MRPSRTPLVGLLAVLVVLSIGPAGTLGAGGSVDVSQGAFAAQAVTGSLSSSTYEVVRGEDVEITFSHSGPATLSIGGEDAGYLLQVDVSGSGSSTVTIDTYASTSSDPDTYVDGGDAHLVYPQGGLRRSLVPAPYTLNLTVGGVPQDLGLLVIEKRPRAEMTAAVAPGGLDLGDIDHGDLQSSLTTRDTVAKGDYAVLEVNATGLTNAIDPDRLGENGAAGITIAFEDLQAQPNVAPQSFDAADPAVETFWDEETSNLLVAWDTADVALYDGRHAYNVTLSIDGEKNHLLTEDRLEDSATVTVIRPRIQLTTGEGQLEVYPWESDVVSLDGTTNLAPGSALQFRAQAFEPRPFLKKSDTTVDENGTISAEMDLGDEARGIAFPLWVLGHREVNAWEITLRESNATVRFENQTAEQGAIARFENVSLSVGGFLVLDGPDGRRLGVSTPIGEDTDSTVNVGIEPPLNRSSYVTVRAVMDWNQNGSYEPAIDRPYTRVIPDGTATNPSAEGTPNGTTIVQNVTETAVVFVPETGEPIPPAATNETNSTSGVPNGTSSPTNATRTPANTTSTATTLSVQTQEPLTPGTSNSKAPLSPAIPVLAVLLAGLLRLWRRP